MRWRRRPDVQQLRREREQLVAELDEVRNQQAWTQASDDQHELSEARAWAKQADALTRALAELDMKLLKAALDSNMSADDFR